MADWVFGVACGIKPAAPGFARARIEPHPDKRLISLGAVFDTVHGRLSSGWKYTEDGIRYEIETPVETGIIFFMNLSETEKTYANTLETGLDMYY